jgi:hypothetical protein
VIRELESAQLPRALPDVDLALINTNYALEAKLDPSQGRALHRGAASNSPYANFIAARKDKGAASPAVDEAGGGPPHAGGPQVHPGQVQGRCHSRVLSAARVPRREGAGIFRLSTPHNSDTFTGSNGQARDRSRAARRLGRGRRFHRLRRADRLGPAARRAAR